MSSTVPVVYLAHPVGAADAAGVARNLAAARRWLAVLLELWPEAALVVSWLPYLDVLEASGASRRRGLRDDLAVVRRCDGIALCGPVVSSGMELELGAALEVHAFGLNLVGVDIDNRDEIRERIEELGRLDPRVLGEARP